MISNFIRLFASFMKRAGQEIVNKAETTYNIQEMEGKN
jgi:hypothetical protein